tara:strand:+ start:551 stop:1207 length:657 start_codon:yes stop_codon:yes gene_type:complete
MIQGIKGLIICGTDTDVGKTIVSALIVQGLNAKYWKPIQSGLEEDGDTGRISKLLGLPSKQLLPEAYKFKAPVSPHWAAEQEDININRTKLKIPQEKDFLVIETAGGLMVPLTRDLLQIEQIKDWNLPIILVARSGLGTLNHTLLSIEALKRRNIPILGIFLNGPKHLDNPKTLTQFGEVPVIGHLPILREVTKTSLREEWEKQNLRATFIELLESIK